MADPAVSPHAIATAALAHYENDLPRHKGKPRVDNEWTVYAAIVAMSGSRTTVISSATGTKCTAIAPCDSAYADCILHDSHAEVLARRGLLRVLWQEICVLVSKDENGNESETPKEDTFRLLERVANHDTDKKNKFCLRSDVQLHLYVSDSPCGDASIYALSSASSTNDSDSSSAVQFTGAKVIVSSATQVTVEDCGVTACLTDTVVAREGEIQLPGRLRTKSGRSNLPAHLRSYSQSCSDKLVRWSVLGLQGRALLANGWVEPVRLTSVVVSRDVRNGSTITDQQKALQRAIPDRTRAVRDGLFQHLQEESETTTSVRATDVKGTTVPTVHVVDAIFARGKAASEQTRARMRHKRKSEEESKSVSPKLSPTGVSLNWNLVDQSVELTVGARGIRQGKKPQTEADWRSLASRLSRRGLWHLSFGTPLLPSFASYADLKQSSATSMDDLRRRIFTNGPLAGWITSEETTIGGCEDPGNPVV
jgi:hypothetical protein